MERLFSLYPESLSILSYYLIYPKRQQPSRIITVEDGCKSQGLKEQGQDVSGNRPRGVFARNPKVATKGLITEKEALSALKYSFANKTPGTDGLPVEFLKFFWPELQSSIVDSFNYAFQSGSLSISQRRGIISLIPKKNKDRTIVENLRPISLLNVDYKILTKVLAKRLEKVLPKLINPDQTGYVKGRYIGENIRLIEDLMFYTQKENLPCLP